MGMLLQKLGFFKGEGFKMRIINFRHYGLNIQVSKEELSKMGCINTDKGVALIDGEEISWSKFVDKHGMAIETRSDSLGHISFTVDRIDDSQYYYVSPSGHKIQFHRLPDGMVIEYVEEPQIIEGEE